MLAQNHPRLKGLNFSMIATVVAARSSSVRLIYSTGDRLFMFIMEQTLYGVDASVYLYNAIEVSRVMANERGRVPKEGDRVESYTWSPSHDQCGMLRPLGTSSADRW